MNPSSIPTLHDEYTAKWHVDSQAGSASGIDALILEQHRQNFALWHEEDRARAPLAPPEQIAQTKRNIDALNQARNDLIEAVDRELLQDLQKHGVKLAGELHSETPGMIIDRLSILSLKIFHTREQVERTDVGDEHVEHNRERLGMLLQQREDLGRCLSALWRDVQSGSRYFKLYRQLKMYNDPRLNPEIYGAQRSAE
jgi:hypothetical protein